MKPETQIKIARRTAIVIVFLFVLFPPLFLYEKMQVKETEIAPKQALLFLSLMYAVMLPYIAIPAGYAWALGRRKLKASIVLFTINTLWGIATVILQGVSLLLFEVPIAILLLLGLLGVSRSLKSSPTKTDDQKQ
jgi:uncharacterized membrane protein